MLEIQSVTGDDWESWRSLRLRALAEAPLAFGSTYEDWVDAPEARWRQRLENADLVNLVAVRDGSPVGMAGGAPGRHPRSAELISMWVDPAARGTGVAEALIAEVEKWAARAADELWLAVMPMNTRAIAMYARYGFALTEETGDPLRDGSGHELRMMKRLTASAASE